MSYSLTNESMTVTGAGESTDEMVSTKTDEYENEDQNPQEDRGPSQDSPNNQGQSEKQQAESETSHSYTQAQWDELEKSREDPEKKVRELEDKCTKQEEFFKEIFPTKYSTNIPLLCWDFANCLNEKKDLEEKYNETCEKYTKVQKDFQCAERKRQELEQANSDLSNQYKEMSERLNDLEEVNESYNRLYG